MRSTTSATASALRTLATGEEGRDDERPGQLGREAGAGRGVELPIDLVDPGHLDGLYAERVEQSGRGAAGRDLARVELGQAAAWADDHQERQVVGERQAAEGVDRVAEAARLHQEGAAPPAQVGAGEDADALLLAGERDDV